jgi:hypothetical protein
MLGANSMEKPPKNNTRRDLLVGVGGFVLFVLLSFGFLMVLNPATAGFLRSESRRLFGGPMVDITLIHTNDTWGYVDPCG